MPPSPGVRDHSVAEFTFRAALAGVVFGVIFSGGRGEHRDRAALPAHHGEVARRLRPEPAPARSR